MNGKRVLLALVVAVFLAVQLPNVLVLGKSADGIEYAAVARNLYEGHGTFFRPYLSEDQWPVHWEQPPLFYGIQGFFFLVLGDSDYVEGVYGVIVGLVVLWIAGRIWRDVRREGGEPDLGAWWPILLLVSVLQFVYLVQANRMLPTFTVFALLSVWLAWRSVLRPGRSLALAPLAGVAVFLGFQVKGPFSLFALAVPGIAWLTLRIPFRRALAATVLSTLAAAGLFFGMLAAFPDAREMWDSLLSEQVVASVRGEREAGRPIFSNLREFGQQMLPPLGLLLVAGLATRCRRLRFSRTTAFFLLVALAGSLPILFLPRQKVRYLIHTFPFFLMAAAGVTEASALRIREALDSRPRVRRGVAAAALLLVLGGATAMFVREGEVTKFHAFHEDIYLRDTGIPEWSVVYVRPGKLIWRDHLWQTFPRHLKASVRGLKPDAPLTDENVWLVIEKDRPVPEGYRRMNPGPVRRYLVLRREEVRSSGPGSG